MKAIQSIMAAGLLVLAVGCGKDAAKPADDASKPAITDISAVTGAADRRSLVGRRVDISSAPAQQVVGNYVFWSGGVNSAVPVVRMDKIKGPVTEHVKKGDRVRLSGVIRLMSEVPESHKMWETAKGGKISESRRADMIGAIVYIEADVVQVVGKSLNSEITLQSDELADGELPEC